MIRGAAALAVLCALSPAAAHAAPIIATLGEGERLHGADGLVEARAAPVLLDAFRGETVAFQIALAGQDEDAARVSIDVAKLTNDERVISVDSFVEHFVTVRARSRNEEEPASSLAWTASSRPGDEHILGELPDALIPVELARCAGERSTRDFCPYPLLVVRGGVAAMWFDVFVPEDTAPGVYASKAIVSSDGRVIETIPITLRVRAARLPFSAVSFFAYYARDSLTDRFRDPDRVERSLWQLLHAHHVDAATALVLPSDVDRLASAFSGDLFARSEGYGGPGQRRPPEIAPIGAYGSLGPPSSEAVTRARAIRAKLPRDIDAFVYAVDEQCESELGPAWVAALAKAAPEHRVLVGHTCGEDPSGQPVDVAIMPAERFSEHEARLARASGKTVYVYNGRLPFAGPLMIDAPFASLTSNGWIAASYDVDRWFFWETIFWNDGNRGGKGPRDVFADPETFHNADGDACLGDGLLVYPGRDDAFPAHSLGVDAVFPSMRLKALRRGIEDAGIVALAASVDRGATLAIDRRIVGAAFEDVSISDEPRFALDARSIARARAELRAIVGERVLTPDDLEARAELARLRDARASRSPVPLRARGVAGVGLPVAFFLVGLGVSLVARRVSRLQARGR